MAISLYWRKLLHLFYATLVIFSLLGLLVLTGRQLGETNPANSQYADFVVYYRSGKMILAGDGKRIYDRELQTKYFNSLSAAKQSTQVAFSQNPPFFFVLLAPFALLPINLAYKIWDVLSIFSVLIAAYFLMKRLHGLSVQQTSIYALAAIISAPGWICVCVGQMSCFITALAIIYYYGFVFGLDILCGVALALSTTKLQYVVLLSVPLLAQKRWRALAAAAVAELVLLGLSAITVGVDNILKYPMTLFDAEATKNYIGVFPEYMISLRGVLGLFLDRHLALVASSVILFGGMIPIFLLWRRQALSATKESSAWAMAITIILSLLFSAHTHLYDDMLLLLPAALTLPLLWSRSDLKQGAVASVIDADSVETAATLPSGKGSLPYKIAERTWQIILLIFPWLSWIVQTFCVGFDPVKRTPFTLINLILVYCGVFIFMRLTKSKVVESNSS